MSIWIERLLVLLAVLAQLALWAQFIVVAKKVLRR
jgi:hypothetical protein